MYTVFKIDRIVLTQPHPKVLERQGPFFLFMLYTDIRHESKDEFELIDQNVRVHVQNNTSKLC